MPWGPRIVAWICALSITCALLPIARAQASTDSDSSDTGSSRLHHFSETAKHRAAAAGSAIKEGAHRVAVASKAVGHEIATAAHRGALEARAALKGEKPDDRSTAK